MDKTAGRLESSGRDWNSIVEAQVRSQQSAAVFCRGHGISYSTFLYHRGKILTKRSLAVVATGSVGVVPVARQRGFIPVRVERSCGIRLRFSMGLVLESDQLPPAAWVVEVARRWRGASEPRARR